MVEFGSSKSSLAEANPDLLIIEDQDASGIRMNPDLVIRNPRPQDKKKVWRQLRRHLDPEAAAAAFKKIYPNTDKTLRGRKPSKKELKKLMNDPEFRDALKKYEDFHGRKADLSKVREVEIPQLGKHDNDIFLIPLGRGPAVSYDASKMIPGSSKANAIYVHPFGEETGEQPIVAVTADGKLIMYLPGAHEVTDWVRG